MFCFQCQETMKNTGCTQRGMCGKSATVANLQDLLIYLLKGISFWGTRGRNMGVNIPEINLFVAQALFATITNANFDEKRFIELIKTAVAHRNTLQKTSQARCQELNEDPCPGTGPDWASWLPSNFEIDELLQKAITVGVQAEPELDNDIRSLRQTITYGLKGIAAYTDHAYIVGGMDDEILAFIQEALDAITDDKKTVEELTDLVLKTGSYGVRAMGLLDKANTDTYGHPEPTKVNLGVKPGPGILISGHDLLDLEELLLQTQGTGVNVYTHGEMLPANAYPGFNKFPNLVGNYGGSWWHQKDEFGTFNGAILMTTNCIVPVRDNYKDRIFSTGMVGYQDVPHIPDREPGKQKDFSVVIEKAKQCGEPQELETGELTIGFAHNAVVLNADKVVNAVKEGKITRFIAMGGCDGRHSSRNYYHDLAKALPETTVILTAGCAKYQYNKLDLGEIDGIPRILDAGQCNDSYSLILIAQKLAEAFRLNSVNDLPLSFDIAWYEQKAVIVLLALLSLGIRNIRLGPTLPAFLSPNVIDTLVKIFDIKPISTVEQDLEAIIAGR